jgi:hypothetical protein
MPCTAETPPEHTAIPCRLVRQGLGGGGCTGPPEGDGRHGLRPVVLIGPTCSQRSNSRHLRRDQHREPGRDQNRDRDVHGDRDRDGYRHAIDAGNHPGGDHLPNRCRHQFRLRNQPRLAVVLLGAAVLAGLIVWIVRSARRRSAATADWRSRLIDAYAKGSALHDAMSAAEGPGEFADSNAAARWADIERRTDDLVQTLYSLREAVPDDGKPCQDRGHARFAAGSPFGIGRRTHFRRRRPAASRSRPRPVVLLRDVPPGAQGRRPGISLGWPGRMSGSALRA